MTTHYIYGIHATKARLERAPEQLLELWVQEGIQNNAVKQLERQAAAQGIAIHHARRDRLDQMAEGGRHQGVIAKCRVAETRAPDLHDVLEGDLRDALFLVLDGVEDPHNLGACLRVADAAGARAVIHPRHRGTGMTATVVKVASGAAESVPLIAVNNLAQALRQMKEAGVWLIGTAADAPQSLYDAKLTGALAMVMGGEGEGMRRLTRELCDGFVSLPMRGQVESLNVSVSAGICLYEALRQRRLKQ